jgi:hypothetical protein
MFDHSKIYNGPDGNKCQADGQSTDVFAQVSKDEKVVEDPINKSNRQE